MAILFVEVITLLHAHVVSIKWLFTLTTKHHKLTTSLVSLLVCHHCKTIITVVK